MPELLAFMSGYECFVAIGAIYLVILGIANLKRADSE